MICMTKAVINRSKSGEIKGFSVKGHAGARKSGEYDMVCSAISAVCYTALGGLKELCGINNYKESDGNLEMALPDDLSAEIMEKSQIILETMEIGLKQIENVFSMHIQVRHREV